MSDRPVIFWFRRDLRLDDNRGLYHALNSGGHVVPVFIFDTNILNKLEDQDDQRVFFIHQELSRLHKAMTEIGSGMVVYHGKPEEIWRDIIRDWNPSRVFLNEDYTPYARKRDEKIRSLLDKQDIRFHAFTDHVVQHPKRVMKMDGTPYTLFTPYLNKWKEITTGRVLDHVPSEKCLSRLIKKKSTNILSLEGIGFQPSKKPIPSRKINIDRIKKYHLMRDYPAKDGTTRMGVHLRFGTVSIRKLVTVAREHNEKYLHELIWREFFQMVLWHFPNSSRENFRKKYNAIRWENDQDFFGRWCMGQTGFPFVDAGMRELLATGYMHNRARMVTASFLTKDLLIDWRWGERWFARYLLDYELASNAGNWQWVAGTGCDAAPYFRVFNPVSQQKKYDLKEEYIRKWIPELSTNEYPDPVIDHNEARKHTIKVYKHALNTAIL